MRLSARGIAPLLSVCFASALCAQGGTAKQVTRRDPDTTSVIHGTIADSAGRALDSIEVYVLSGGRSARTDDRGRYTLTHLIEGPTRLRARRLGWAAVDTTVFLDAHSAIVVNFRMQSRAPALDTIRVTTSQDDCAPRKLEGFACRRKAGVGVFRDAAQLAALHPETIADLFDGVPGLRRMGPGVEATTRWRCIYYLIDGHPPMSVERMTYASAPWVKDVVAVEFYEDADTAPAWYQNFTWVERGHHQILRCSLIVYWTKGSR
jgi:hypothetical protein